jgi:hypothetical protein
MAHKTTTPRIEVRRPPSAEDLRQVFEAAVCTIHQADLAVKKNPEHRTPIVQRERFVESRAYAEKRALSDAAQALALLWKV